MSRPSSIAYVLLMWGLLLSQACASTKGMRPTTNENEKAIKLFKEGVSLLDQNPQEALERFDRASQLDKSFIPAFFNAGIALELLGRFHEAANRYESCLLVDKTSSSCLENLLLIKAKLGDIDGAVKLADLYLEQYPEELFAKVARAKLWLFQKDYAMAEKLAREVIERDAENVEALFIMAQVFYDKKQYPAAKFVLKNALELAPSYGAMYLTLGHVYAALDQLHDALDSYALAVKYQPSDEALESYGLLLLNRGRSTEALSILKRQAELRPKESRNYLNLGNAYVANRDFSLAKASYQRALELSPDDKDVIFNLGLLYLELKTESLPDLERLKTSKGYFESYLQQDGLPKERVDEVKGYLKTLADKIEALEYVPEPEPEEEQLEEGQKPEQGEEHAQDH